jgi:hypothetical protein
MSAISGSCNHPGCTWTGLSTSYKKHKDGAGRARRIEGKHEDCTCCSFVPVQQLHAEAPCSTLHATMAALGQQEHVSLHEHMQGEFHRTARIQDLCANYLCIMCNHVADAAQD